MNLRLALPAVCLSIAFPWAILSQTAADKPAAPPASDEKKQPEAKQPARETPPDTKAYTDASRINDPVKKIEALEKFKKDFPKSAQVSSANMNILSTLASRMPEQTARIRAQVKLVYKEAAKEARGRTANSIADALLNGNVLLKDAEGYAQKGVKDMNEGRYIKEQLASSASRKRQPPSREDMLKRFREMRATRAITLGRVEAALGKDQRARQLLEEAYKDAPSNAAAAAALGELLAKQGDNARAMDLLTTARLSGRAAASTVSALESAYRKTHGGSLDGLDGFLNGEYHRRFPNPLTLEPYKPTEKRSNRMVLAEVFTGAGCPPCVAADLAFEAAMQRYDRKDLAVVMYHEHVPRPDPMTNPDTQARSKAYAVTGVPTYAIDGKTTVGGGSRENTKSVYDGARGFNKDIEADLEKPAEAKLTLAASLANGQVKVNAAVDKIEGDSKDLKLQILLVEKELVYSGENGIRFHPMVVRAMAGPDAAGFAIDPQSAGSFDATFDIAKVSAAIRAHLDDYESKGHRGEAFKFIEKKYQIDARDLAVAAFVQDAQTKHVLQAGYVDLAASSMRLVSEQR